jgi:DNA-binding PadR family transcriptional regulator
MDVLVLTELEKGALGAYEIIQIINEKFGVVMSPASVYSSVYSLERKGLLKGSLRGRTRIYELTEKGKEDLQFLLRANEVVESFIANISTIET